MKEKDIMSLNKCQIHCFPLMSEKLSAAEVIWQRKNRLKRMLKRRCTYLKNLYSDRIRATDTSTDNIGIAATNNALQAGDLVRVRSKEEIQATLNRWNQLRGCAFMEEMVPYCGTTQRVLKRVERFLDERDYLIKKCKGIVVLDKVLCNGTKDFGPCDRSCFFFWKEDWLEKID